VQEKLRKLRRDFDKGLVVGGERQTLEQYLSQWLADVAKPRLRPRAFDGYEEHITRNIVPTLGNVPLKKLAPQDVQRLVNAKTEEGLAPRTVRYMRAVLRTALKQAVIWGLAERNAAESVSMPRIRKAERTVLTPEQVRALVDAASQVRNGSLFTVAMAVGLRIGEACGLRWADIDLSAKTLHVVQAIQWRKGKPTVVEPKSDSSRRTVRLPDFAVETLKSHRARQKEDRLAAGKDWVELGLVFTTIRGTILDYANVRKDFKRLLRSCGLPDIGLHGLRHTCATMLMVQGVAPKVVMETLGHSQISLTLDTYSHVSVDFQKVAAEKMDELFRTA
jgi:integrase